MAEEVNYKVKFMEHYYNTKKCGWDVNYVDVVVYDNKKNPLLYIESKDTAANEQEKRRALAQAVLTNKKQPLNLSKSAVICKDKDANDVLIEIDCTSNDVLYNNDINWEKDCTAVIVCFQKRYRGICRNKSY